jgi:hypothetical protein
MALTYNKIKFIMMVLFPSINFIAWTFMLPFYTSGFDDARTYAIFDLTVSWFMLVFQWSMNQSLAIFLHSGLITLLMFVGIELFKNATKSSLFFIIFTSKFSDLIRYPILVIYMYFQLWMRTIMAFAILVYYKNDFLKWIGGNQRNNIEEALTDGRLGRFRNGRRTRVFKLWVFEQRECPICSDAFIDDVSLLTCGHCFHSECIERWSTLSIFNNCPSCRNTIEPV